MLNQIADYVELKLATPFDPTSDTTVDLVEVSQLYGLTNQKTSAVMTRFRLSIFETTDKKERITVSINGVAANGTLGGYNRWTATIEDSDSSNSLIGLANTDDGTNADANIIAANVTGLSIDEFSTDSVALVKVGSAEYNEMTTAFEGNVANRGMQMLIAADGVALQVGDNRGSCEIFEKYDQNEIGLVYASYDAAGTTGDTTIQLHNVTTGNDILSTPITIASGAKYGTGVIDATYKVVSAHDIIRADVDSVAGTPPEGMCRVSFELTN